MKRIVLTGFRGTGKTDTGRVLARQSGVRFIDTDFLIELETGRSIRDIFEEDGEERFRDIERGVIATLPETDAVIGTGGGAVLDPVNMERLRRNSVVVLLFANLETIEERLSRSPRPPLTSLPLAEEIAQKMDDRRLRYYASADLCVDTSGTTPAAAAEKISILLKKGTVTPAGRSAGLAFFRSGRIPPPALSRLEEILKPGDDDGAQPRLMGVAGFPAAHSRGPYLFNTLFSRYQINYHYTWFEHPDIREIMTVARGLGVKGLSVTIPFKQEVIGLVDEVDEHGAQQIGSVNTVVFACGEAVGHNTDWIGVRKPLVSLKGSRAVLLGAGGVAAAAAYALTDLDMDLTILNRTPEKARALAEKFGCRWKAWDEFDSIKPDVVVNATPLGMQPDTRSPLREGQITGEMTVFDLVYTPPMTPLLETARKKGCTVIQGTEMFVEQAREQFYLFFGIDVPSGVVKECLA